MIRTDMPVKAMKIAFKGRKKSNREIYEDKRKDVTGKNEKEKKECDGLKGDMTIGKCKRQR